MSSTTSANPAPLVGVVALMSSHTRCNQSKIRYEWTLHDFDNLVETLGKSSSGEILDISSDPFRIPGDPTGTMFQLFCQRIGNDGKPATTGGFLGLYFRIPGAKEDKRVAFSMAVKDKDGVPWQSKKCDMKAIAAIGKGWSKALSLVDLKAESDKLLPDGNLTLVWELTLQHSSYTNEVDGIPKFGNAKTTLTNELSELLRTHPETADVVLVCEDKEFPVHKLVLSARSPVFKAMFVSEGFEEDTSGKVMIPDFSPMVVETFVKAIYSDDDVGDIIKGGEGEGDLVCDLFRISEKYGMNSIKVACEKILSTNLDLGNCARILQWALVCNGEILAEMARKFIQENAAKVMSTPGFCDLMTSYPDAMLSGSEKKKRKKEHEEEANRPAAKVAKV